MKIVNLRHFTYVGPDLGPDTVLQGGNQTYGPGYPGSLTPDGRLLCCRTKYVRICRRPS